MKCEYCQTDATSVSNYNPEHKFECSVCSRKRLKVYNDTPHDELVKKLLDTHRELHCHSESLKDAWHKIEGANLEIDKLKGLLREWWWVGNATQCQGLLQNRTIIKPAALKDLQTSLMQNRRLYFGT